MPDPALRTDLVFPLLGETGAVLDGELAVILDQLDRGRAAARPSGGSTSLAHRVGVAELGLDALRLLAEQEVDELLGALRDSAPPLMMEAPPISAPVSGGKITSIGCFDISASDGIVLPSHAGDGFAASHQRDRPPDRSAYIAQPAYRSASASRSPVPRRHCGRSARP